MKTNFIFLYCFFLCTAPIFSQVTDTFSTNNLKLERIIPVLNKGYIIYKTDSLEQPTVVDLSFFDMNHQLVSSRTIPTSRTNEWFAVEETFVWDNSFVLLASLYHPGPQRNHLLLYQFNLPDLTLKQSKILLKTTAPPDVYVPYFSKLSPDKSKLLVAGWNYTKPKENAQIVLKVLDKELKTSQEKKYDFDFQNRRFAIDEIFLSNSETIYLTGNNYRGLLSIDASPSPVQMDHFVVGFTSDIGNKYWAIKKTKHFFPSFKYVLAENSTLVGMGFWTKGAKDGVGFLKINPKVTILEIQTAIIPPELLKKTFTTDSIKLDKFYPNYADYDLRHLIAKKDAYYLIGERNIFTSTKEILVAKYTLEGSLVWIKLIPKIQPNFNETDEFLSFALFERKDKLYFLFNNAEQNRKENVVNITNLITPPTPQLTLAELSLVDGTIKKRPIKNVINENFIFSPIYSQLIGKEDALFVGKGIKTKKGAFLLKKIKMKN